MIEIKIDIKWGERTFNGRQMLEKGYLWWCWYVLTEMVFTGSLKGLVNIFILIWEIFKNALLIILASVLILINLCITMPLFWGVALFKYVGMRRQLSGRDDESLQGMAIKL